MRAREREEEREGTGIERGRKSTTSTETHAVRHLDSVKVNYIFKSCVPAI